MKWVRGYMTVELILAVIVGAVLILGLHNIVTSHIYLSQRGRDLIIANAYAEQKIEALRSAGYLTLTNGTSNITAELPSELKAPRSASLTISDQTTAIKKVYLSVTYNEQGTPRTQTYTTYIGELGVGQN
jgi:hypothetical protein